MGFPASCEPDVEPERCVSLKIRDGTAEPVEAGRQTDGAYELTAATFLRACGWEEDGVDGAGAKITKTQGCHDEDRGEWTASGAGLAKRKWRQKKIRTPRAAIERKGVVNPSALKAAHSVYRDRWDKAASGTDCQRTASSTEAEVADGDSSVEMTSWRDPAVCVRGCADERTPGCTVPVWR